MHYELQPIRLQAGWRIEWNNFSEYDMDLHGKEDAIELNEDLLQLCNDKAKLVIDLGWYPSFDPDGQYLLLLVRNHCWDSPLEKTASKSKTEIISQLEKWVNDGFFGKYV
ncbi:MAG: hypothetical protein HFG20_03415 [Anaerotruncus sp.]|nr:hypothetical protein [Anaerotruncus sp.]